MNLLPSGLESLATIVSALVDADIALFAERLLDGEGHLVEIDRRHIDVVR